jgi:hypothetical protein
MNPLKLLHSMCPSQKNMNLRVDNFISVFTFCVAHPVEDLLDVVVSIVYAEADLEKNNCAVQLRG